MDTKKMKEHIQMEAFRVYNAIQSIDPLDDGYVDLARLWLDMIIYGTDDFYTGTDIAEEPEAINEAIKQNAPVTKPEEPKPVREKYTLEEVRELFREAATSGIRIQPIVKQFVEEREPSKLSSVKPERYPELVAALEEAKSNAQ
jgi:hypothetical protein